MSYPPRFAPVSLSREEHANRLLILHRQTVNDAFGHIAPTQPYSPGILYSTANVVSPSLLFGCRLLFVRVAMPANVL